LAHISGCFLTETVCKYPWLPTIAITSEKWVFYAGLSGFLVVGKNSGLLVSACTDLPEKKFPDFSRPP